MQIFFNLRQLLLIWATLASFATILSAYSGGDGTASSPYEINNVTDLILLGNTTSHYSKYFKLTADIDMAGAGIFTNAVIAPDTSTVSGFQGTPFRGNFNGNGHIISNLTVNGTVSDAFYCGLFGRVSSSGVILNLGLEKVSVSGNYVGGLCGNNQGTIISSYCSGSVEGSTYYTGGLCGYNGGGSIISSYSSASVRGSDYTGGLCGYNYGTITDSYSSGNVDGNAGYVGGLCGFSYDTISNSYSSGDVSGTGNNVGGLCGFNYGNITNSFSSGDVSATGNSVGGLCGYNYAAITDSYSIGSVSGTTNSVGGLCGFNYGTITSSYSSGNVDGIDYVGGLCGYNVDTITDSYSNGNVSGMDYVGSLSGYNYDTGIITSSYSNGSVDGRDCVGGLCGENFGTITICYASGSVTGINSVGGLCGRNTGPGTIISSYSSSSVNGKGHVGGLCGRNSSTITNSYSSGDTVGRYWEVGGLCGVNYGGLVESCYATGNVKLTNSSAGNTGGLVGVNQNSASIKNCYATGSVTSVGYRTGGLCGDNRSAIINSYSIGFVNSTGGAVGGMCGENTGIITSSFWNIQTSGWAASFGGTGLNTAQMSTIQNFINAGWDFVTDDGDPADWQMAGNNYPKLSWQITPDIDNSGKVDMLDLAILAKNWLGSGTSVSTSDLDKSGTVDLSDLELFAWDWLAVYFNFDTLIGHWKLDETAGTTAIDSSSYYNDGLIIGDPSRATGFRGNCYSFDSVDDCVVSAGCQGVQGSNPRTVSAFIKANPETAGVIRSIVSWGVATPGAGAKWFVALDDATGQLAVGVYGARTKGGPNLKDGQWHHVAVVLPVGGSQISDVLLYVDGLQVTASYTTQYTINTDSSSVVVGALNKAVAPNPDQYDYFFNGMIDDVRIYNTGLSALEINRIFNPSSVLAGHWKLDEAEGNFAADSSIYANSGTVIGTPARTSGKIYNCYWFDSNDDRVVVEGFRGIAGSEPRTVTAFIKADLDLENLEKDLHGIVSWGSPVTNGRAKWFVSIDDQTGQLALGIYGARVKGGPDLEDGQWHHIAVVLPNGATNINQVKLYVDGSEVTTNATSQNAIIDTALSEVSIGAVNHSTTSGTYTATQLFKGGIDDVRIYDIALTPAEIATLSK